LVGESRNQRRHVDQLVIEAEIRTLERSIAQQDAAVIDALRRGLDPSQAERLALQLRRTLERMRSNRREIIREDSVLHLRALRAASRQASR
jgi:hypothetical protein